jgi:hypothetical protein
MMVLLAASDAAAAGIAAGGAVVGALVGGFLTYGIERRREETQRERDRAHEESQRARERETEARVTQGIARVWSKKLGDFYVVVVDHSPPRAGSVWWSDENDVDSEIDVEDMKRVAAVATTEQWTAIDYALSHVREARAARAFALSRDRGSLSQKDIDTLEKTMEQIERAIEQLATLSGDRYPPDWLTPRIERSEQRDGWPDEPPNVRPATRR